MTEAVNAITWQQFADSRKILLNLITPEHFEKKYGPQPKKVGLLRGLFTKLVGSK